MLRFRLHLSSGAKIDIQVMGLIGRGEVESALNRCMVSGGLYSYAPLWDPRAEVTVRKYSDKEFKEFLIGAVDFPTEPCQHPYMIHKAVRYGDPVTWFRMTAEEAEACRRSHEFYDKLKVSPFRLSEASGCEDEDYGVINPQKYPETDSDVVSALRELGYNNAAENVQDVQDELRYETRPSGRQVSFSATAKTERALLRWRESILGSYPTGGYGTSVSKPRLTENGRWYASGSRSSSCD